MYTVRLACHLSYSAWGSREGGGGWGGEKVPAPTLNVNNLFNIETNATKLVTFPNIYLETIWYYTSSSKQYDVSMVTVF